MIESYNRNSDDTLLKHAVVGTATVDGEEIQIVLTIDDSERSTVYAWREFSTFAFIYYCINPNAYYLQNLMTSERLNRATKTPSNMVIHEDSLKVVSVEIKIETSETVTLVE